jgi:hypothetical protein
MESVTTNSPESSSASGATPIPIAEFAAREDFPQCTLHQLVDIGGYAGTVVDIVHNSLKVRSPEQHTRSFNFHILKKLYGPRPEPQPIPVQTQTSSRPTAPSLARESSVTPVEVKKRDLIENPDFTQTVQPINLLTGRPDFPQCAFGQHVEVNGYTGVVVEIVNRSLKIRSQEQVTRSYNADVLKKLYPPDKK